jgi:hypothetical protein
MTQTRRVSLAMVAGIALLVVTAVPVWAQRGGGGHGGGGGGHFGGGGHVGGGGFAHGGVAHAAPMRAGVSRMGAPRAGYARANVARANVARSNVARSNMPRVTVIRATAANRGNFRVVGSNGGRLGFTRDRFGRWHRFVGPIWPGYYGYWPYDWDYFDNGFDNGYYNGYDNGSGYGEPNYDTEPQGPPPPAEGYAPAPSEPAVVRDNTLPDTSQLILVRKDGQILRPEAFTISGDRLVYITKEGARMSFPAADLDRDTTRQMNAANGNNITIPD